MSSLNQAEIAIKQGDNVQTQTDAAILQGENIGTLTKMTVYIAFPLLFTASVFSMDIVRPSYPWAVLACVLVLTFVLNYLIASMIAKRMGVSEVWYEVRRVWRDLYAVWGLLRT